MSADGDRVRAAIAKLERLRDAATQPTDGNAWIQGRSSRRYENPTEVFSGPNENTPGSADIVTYIREEDAELIATLHRTIEPVLEVLRSAIHFADHDTLFSDAPELLLADAINGGAA